MAILYVCDSCGRQDKEEISKVTVTFRKVERYENAEDVPVILYMCDGCYKTMWKFVEGMTNKPTKRN